MVQGKAGMLCRVEAWRGPRLGSRRLSNPAAQYKETGFFSGVEAPVCFPPCLPLWAAVRLNVRRASLPFPAGFGPDLGRGSRICE